MTDDEEFAGNRGASLAGPSCQLTADQTPADMAQMITECFGPDAAAALAGALTATRDAATIDRQCHRLARAWRRNLERGGSIQNINQVRMLAQAQALLWARRAGLDWSAAEHGALLLFQAESEDDQ